MRTRAEYSPSRSPRVSKGFGCGSAKWRDEKLLALSGNDLSVFNHKEPLVVELADAGGGPSRSPRVSKGLVAATQESPPP